MYCTQCGTEAAADARFCMRCGRALAPVSPAAAPSVLIAPAPRPVRPPQPVPLVGARPGQRLVESHYAADELVTASRGRRLAGFALEVVLFVLTLGVGWVVWWIRALRHGQTPAKQLLHMYVLREDGTRASGGWMIVREGGAKRIFLAFGLSFLGLVTVFWWILPLLYLPTLVGALWCLWDDNNRALWDKIVDTYVAYSPNGYRPLTEAEARRARFGGSG